MPLPSIRRYTPGNCTEAMENWRGTFFAKWLRDVKPYWCLHAALVGGQILLRAGYVWTDDGEEGYVRETSGNEISWILKDNANEIWVNVFREDLGKELVLSHRGVDFVKVQLKRSA